MGKVKLTITESNCRCGYVKMGDIYVVDDLYRHTTYSVFVSYRGGEGREGQRAEVRGGRAEGVS